MRGLAQGTAVTVELARTPQAASVPALFSGTERELCVGSRVQRGKDWNSKNKDGGKDAIGIVIALKVKAPAGGHVNVLWPNGKEMKKLKYGMKDQFEVERAPDLRKLLKLPDRKARAELFRRMDVNGSGTLSLPEVAAAVAQLWPNYNCKPVLDRAYQSADKDDNGAIERKEFRKLLYFLVHFNDLWTKFQDIDKNGDGRLNQSEFLASCGKSNDPYSLRVRVQLIRHFKTCTTEIYLHIVARMAD